MTRDPGELVVVGSPGPLTRGLDLGRDPARTILVVTDTRGQVQAHEVVGLHLDFDQMAEAFERVARATRPAAAALRRAGRAMFRALLVLDPGRARYRRRYLYRGQHPRHRRRARRW